MVERVKQPDRKGVCRTFFVLVDPKDVPAHSLNVSEQFAVGIVFGLWEFSFHGMLHCQHTRAMRAWDK